MAVFETTWKAPSNIALIKYWGKHGNQLPANPSLSITLNKSHTITRLSAFPSGTSGNNNSGADMEYLFEGTRLPGFEERVKRFLEKLMPEMPFLAEYSFSAGSRNTFPHSAGIASSASSMASIALCLADLEQFHTGSATFTADFWRRASCFARLGSGSASRSVYGRWVSWGASAVLPGSSDEYATPLTRQVHPLFDHPGVAILVVSSEKKTLSSTAGHGLMEQHPFSGARYRQAHDNLRQLIRAMEEGNFEAFANITEMEALTLHSLLMTSSSEGLLMKPASLQIMDAVRKFRKNTGLPVCFTMDAGPNVLLIYPQQFRSRILPFIEETLSGYCENGRWIDDEMGDGPVRENRRKPF